MHKTKSSTPEYCTNHPKAKATCKCTICGKNICTACTVMHRGKACCLPCKKKRDSGVIVLTSAPVHHTRPLKIKILALVTFLLFIIASAIWSAREIYVLHQENKSLRESRLNLINTLRENNREIKDLRSQLLSAPIDTIKPKIPNLEIKPAPRLSSSPVWIPESPSKISFNNGAQDKPLVALTFDGGSDANAAGPILDTLRSRNVKATIFLTGQFIKKFPDIVTQYFYEGHIIGNHTATHPHLTSFAQDKTQTTLTGITREFICKELSDNDARFFALTGQHFTPIWRAPYGEFNNTICQWARECGYIHVGWRQGKTWRQSLDSNDWIPNEETPGFKTPQEVMDKILGIADANSEALNGGIILMHLGSARNDPQKEVYTVLGSLIDRLHQRGFQFVTVPEMIQQSEFYLASIPENIHFE